MTHYTVNAIVPCRVGMSITVSSGLLPLYRLLICLNVKVDKEDEVT